MKIEVRPDRKLVIDGEDAPGRHLRVVRRNTGTQIVLDDQEVTEPCEVWMRGVLFASNAINDLRA